MGWFSTRSEKKIQDMEERLEKLESGFKSLRFEWEDAYDKLRTITARFAKRAQQIEKHEQLAEQGNDSPTGLSTGTAPPATMLDPVSRRILERRARLFPPVRKEGSA